MPQANRGLIDMSRGRLFSFTVCIERTLQFFGMCLKFVCAVTPRVCDMWNIWSFWWTMGVQLAGHFPLVWPCLSTGNSYIQFLTVWCPELLSELYKVNIYIDSECWLWLHVSYLVCSASRHQLLVPRYRLSSLGRRSFAVAGPMTWNSLSADLCDPTCSDESQTFIENIFVR